jgi:predicted Zn finger-like uncharacterized protein
MGLVTRCPACGTAFRLGAEQLKAQHGTVRCGRCAAVFNAFESLYTLPDMPGETPAPEGPPSPPAAAEAGAEPVELLSVSVGGAPASGGAAAEAGAAAQLPPTSEHERIEPTHAAPRRREPPAVPGVARRGGSRAWALGSVVLLVALAAQVTYLLRVEIAALLPETRPWLEIACAQIGCSVPLPQHIEHWSIDSSDLQSEPADPGRMTLTAVLRNRASLTQEFPALELTLTDVQDRAVARRVLAPAEYLPPDAKADAGLRANGEVVVRLVMDTGELDAAGYRLFLFYP